MLSEGNKRKFNPLSSRLLFVEIKKNVFYSHLIYAEQEERDTSGKCCEVAGKDFEQKERLLSLATIKVSKRAKAAPQGLTN